MPVLNPQLPREQRPRTRTPSFRHGERTCQKLTAPYQTPAGIKNAHVA
jgi:hypothetical protein